MLSVLFIVLPIFAVILAGWGARRCGALGPHAAGELNRFVVNLALPALLFDIIATARWRDIWRPDFVAAFSLGAGIVFLLALPLRLWRTRHVADAAIGALSASYANTAFIGFPLVLAVLGRPALTLALIATILTVSVLFAVALILVEIGQQTERHPRHLARKVAGSLLRNPMLVAPVLGGIMLAGGVTMPAFVQSFLTLLGSAASPCALVSVGLFLAEKRASAEAGWGEAAPLVACKLIAQPLATWLVATRLCHLAPPLVQAAVLLAALPTGTGPFMVAEYYRREAALTSRALLASTVASVITITLYLGLTR